jgi:prepilin-type N-terminal cleavage/methylation domain-containing protein
MMTKTITTSGSRASGAARRTGFTLLEMMVVIGLVALMASMALPSVIALFNSGADAQAYNLISAQFTAARARAVVSNTYAGVHVQMADALNEAGTLLRPELDGVSFSGLIVYDSEQKWFDLTPGMVPQRIPGNVSFGYASEVVLRPTGALTGTLEATIGTSAGSPFTGMAGTITKFTTFSVIFNSLGAVTRFANGDPIHFIDQSPDTTKGQSEIFTDAATTDVVRFGSKRLWRLAPDYVQDRYGVTAVTMFDMSDCTTVPPTPNQLNIAKLNENAQLLPLNIHTGQLFGRR